VAERIGQVGSPFLGLSAGKGRVIFTSLDVTCGLLGTRTWGIAGFEPEYAQSFLKNLLFWTLDGRPEPPAPATTQPTTQPATEPASQPASQPATGAGA
jgi:hypothetical protein